MSETTTQPPAQRDERDGWSITVDGFDPATSRAVEGLFTQGSGYLHLRGSLEEPLADAPQNEAYLRLPANVTAEAFTPTPARWGTYVPGVFAQHPTLNREMVNLPWFLWLTPIVDGQRLDAGRCAIEAHRRTLDLRRALLSRSLTWKTDSGATIGLHYERIVSAVEPRLCAQRMTVESDRAVELTIESGIDADVRTNGHDHLREWTLSHPSGRDLRCVVWTEAGEAVTTQSRHVADAPWSWRPDSRRGAMVATRRLEPGEPVTVEKRSAVATSRDLRQSDPREALDHASGQRFEGLVEAHAAVWARRWAVSDVVVEGDPDTQLALRASIYHLLRAHCNDSRVAIDAKGYAGEAYFGRYFWDTEMYLLPFYLYTEPEKARTLMDFRINTLDGARRNAARFGYPGARFAWESDDRGDECCAAWQYRDHEVHVTADVVYALAHYAAATGDGRHLHRRAGELIVETARYWVERIDQRDNENHPSLLGVMGPDEYTPISHNNAYTNRLVAFALQMAAEHGAGAGADEAELQRFASLADRLPILRDADRDLVLQCEDFELLAEPRFDDHWPDRSKSIASQVAQERLYRTKCLKQPDVLLMMLLFPDEFADAEWRAAWDYYVPRTCHDSSLSYGTHAIVAAKLGKVDEAWAYFGKSRDLDLDVANGKAAEGIHIACAANNWSAVVLGFLGLETAMRTGVLTLAPRLPRHWRRVSCPLVWKGEPVTVEADGMNTTITNRGGADLQARVHHQQATVPAGTSRTFGAPS